MLLKNRSVASGRSAPSLHRSMSFWDVVALGVNGMIGAGIFLLPGVIAEQLGASAILAAMLAGLIAAMNVWCLASIAQHYSTTGGAYLYAKDYLGRVVGFEIGWLNWCSRMLSWAAIAHGFAIALRSQIGADAPAWLYPVAVTGLIVSLTALNLRGVVFGARVSTFFTMAKLVPIVVFIVVAAMAFESRRFEGILDFQLQALGDGTLVVFWAFLGFESIVVTAGEMKNPSKMMWPALVTIIAVVTAVYLLVITMVFGSLDQVGGRENPVVDASRELMGPFGSQMISLGILISVFGMASAHALVAPRCLFAMAEHHDLPSAVAWIHAVYRTPVVAIVLSGAITLALAFSGSFKDLAVLSVLARFAQYLTTAIAVVMMTTQQYRKTGWTFRRWRAYLIPIVTLGASLWVMGQANQWEWLKVFIAGGLGLPLLLHTLYKERAST